MTADQYPAKSHARKAAKHLEASGAAASENTLWYIEAAKTTLWPHSDQTVPLRQHRYFYYLTGYEAPDAIVTYCAKTDKITLYIPEIDDEEVMWSGLPLSAEQIRTVSDVDEIKYMNHLEGDLKGKNLISVETYDKRGEVTMSQPLLDALDEARAIKDSHELALMRHASKITDNSHLAVMSALPIEKNEGHIHAEFIYHSIRQGSKNQSYDPICCAGTSAGTLHYVKNDLPLDDKLLVLIDAGAEWKNYASDVTRCFPISGEWTKECRDIYEAVLDIQNQCIEKVKPGVNYEDLHRDAHRILIRHLMRLGIFTNGTEDEIFDSRVSCGFFPHGLGHMLGMDTHDTAGRPNYEDKDPMYRYLRLRRTLEENMVLTIEPGCYFNKYLLDHFIEPEQEKFLDRAVLDKYWTVGGVRIEDDILVTDKGYENFTKMTKDPEEVAKIVKDGIAKGRKHFHCVV